jgi:hypothetical protein
MILHNAIVKEVRICCLVYKKRPEKELMVYACINEERRCFLVYKRRPKYVTPSSYILIFVVM